MNKEIAAFLAFAGIVAWNEYPTKNKIVSLYSPEEEEFMNFCAKYGRVYQNKDEYMFRL